MYATKITSSLGCVVPVIHVQKSAHMQGMLAADTIIGSQECNPCTAEAESLQISLMPGFTYLLKVVAYLLISVMVSFSDDVTVGWSLNRDISVDNWRIPQLSPPVSISRERYAALLVGIFS